MLTALWLSSYDCLRWSYHITFIKVVTVGGQSGAISPVGALSPGGEEVASGVGVSQEASFRFLDSK